LPKIRHDVVDLYVGVLTGDSVVESLDVCGRFDGARFE